MNRKTALLISILLTLLLAYFSSYSHNEASSEYASVSRVIDGDTLELEDGRIIRLLNINSPEKGALNAELSKEFLELFVNSTLEFKFEGNDKYGRSLARIYSQDYLNLKIVELGLASKFLVDDNELKE